jgi:hypothetical protein
MRFEIPDNATTLGIDIVNQHVSLCLNDLTLLQFPPPCKKPVPMLWEKGVLSSNLTAPTSTIPEELLGRTDYACQLP